MGTDEGFAIRSYFTGLAGVEMIFLQDGERQGKVYRSDGKKPGPGKIVAQSRKMGNPKGSHHLASDNEIAVSRSLR
jgi:hypothetical protein